MLLLGLRNMQKTNKSIAKRFKVTASGKVLHFAPGYRHLLRNKSSRQLRNSGGSRSLGKGIAAQVMRAIAPGL